MGAGVLGPSVEYVAVVPVSCLIFFWLLLSALFLFSSHSSKQIMCPVTTSLAFIEILTMCLF